ncbi:MAG: DNA recombination protein RmuC [Planctomycetes bacterium]|nr:DNA recombination protein RmuC [Planctomycetota bacterium]
MEVILPIIMFVLGFAAGGGILAYLFRRRLEEARAQERNIALVDVRVAEEKVNGRDGRICELQAALSQRDQTLHERIEENSQLRQQYAILHTSLKKEQEKVEEKIKLLDKAEQQFKDAFKALAADALKNNTSEFREKCKPVEDTLKQIDAKIGLVNSTATDLGTQLSKFVKVMQKPEVRGQYGEMHLERVLEITGMSARCDFYPQQVVGDDVRLRPDVVVKLPGDRHVAVDAKATLQMFLEMVEAPDDDARQNLLKQFVGHVRSRIKELSSKAYHQHLDGSPEFVVLYLPTEGLFCAALSLDADLLEFADAQGVVLAGPTTLIALLRSVAQGWKQEALAKHATEIRDLGKELYKRLATFADHVASLRYHLDGSVKAYNEFVGSLERMVMPQARKFRDYGAAGNNQLDELAQIDMVPRTLQSPDFAVVEADGEVTEPELLSRPR